MPLEEGGFMLKLQHIDAIEMLKFFNLCINDYDKKRFETLKIKTIADLEGAIKENYKNFFGSFSYERYDKTLRKIKKIEEKYTLQDPSSISYFQDLSMIFESSKRESEENTKGDELLLYSIVGQSDRSSFNFLLNLNIDQIKKLFYCQDDSSKPLILQAAKIGLKNLQAIINAINLFDEQILRQNEEKHLEEVDLFHLNYEEKKLSC